MARPLRVAVPDGIYHWASRGFEQRPLLATDADRLTFLRCLERTVRRYHWSLLTYCLMENHFHLVVRTPQANLSRGAQHLKSCYGMAFNRRYKRKSPVYDGRFGGWLIQRESYLLEVLRYIALNPVRAELCTHPVDWPWSAHRSLVGLAEPGLVSVEETRSFFDGLGTYEAFVADAPRVVSAAAGVVVGDREFVREVLSFVEPDPEIPRAHWGAGRPELAEIFDGAERDEGIASAHVTHGYTMASIAAHLGCHVSTVSRRLKRYEAG